MTEKIKKSNITHIDIILIGLISLVLFVWCSKPETSPINLQKQMLAAKTDIERQKILDRLDKYYLSMSIPDSIRQCAQAEVDTFLKNYKKNRLALDFDKLDTNVYRVENLLRGMLQDAMIERVQNDVPAFHGIIEYARALADTVDARTNYDYWRPWVEKVEQFDAVKANAWLLADRAERLCDTFLFKDYATAEKSGGYGLQLLASVNDARLRLDIIQRMLIILSRYLGMYDLSYPLFQREIQVADEIKYHIRSTGLSYHYGNAHFLAGNNKLALENFNIIIQKAEQYSEVPFIDYYRIHGYLGTAKANRELGNYEKAISICNQAENPGLNYSNQISLLNTRGLAYRSRGNYDKAEGEYTRALNLAIQAGNAEDQIVALNNLGFLYYLLTEYDKATSFYDQAMAILLSFNPEQFEMRSKLLMSLAEVKLAKHEIEKFNDLIREATELTEFINLPIVKAQILRSLGRINLTAQKYQQANDQFLQAVALFDQSGFLRASLETKVDLAQSYINLSNNKQAKVTLDELYGLAKDIGDEQGLINALGLQARIAHNEGKIDFAIKKSNQLIDKVEELSLIINELDHLIFFRQKVCDYLKDAVVYELQKGRIDSAFVKLDYMKAREFKNGNEYGSIGTSKNRNVSHFINIESLKSELSKNQLVISYLTTPDVLYAFVLDKENLKLFKKTIEIEQLRQLVNTYVAAIIKSIDVLQNSQPDFFIAHYDSVVSLGQNLFKIVLGWQELQIILQNKELTYIIPDDILHAIPYSCLVSKSQPEPLFLIQQTAISNLPGAVFVQSTPTQKVKEVIFKKRILISADYQFPGVDGLVHFLKEQFPGADELVVDRPVIAKEDILTKLQEKYDIYFFIGHSVANIQMPDLSYFELTARTKAELKPFSVPVSLMDFKNIDWSHAEMVFLIGCETAIGKLYEGSGFAGFQQSLLCRGAKTVLASMWKIDASYAINQIQWFLKSWENTGIPAISLRNVEIKMIQNLNQDNYFKKPHPYMWGTFNISQTSNH